MSTTKKAKTVYYEATTAMFRGISEKMSVALLSAINRKKVGYEFEIDGECFIYDFCSRTSYNPRYGTRGISFYFKRKRDGAIVRISDHWSGSFETAPKSGKLNCGYIASCFWEIKKGEVFDYYGAGSGRHPYRMIGGVCKKFSQIEQRDPQAVAI